MWKETNKFRATFSGSEKFYPLTKGEHFGQDFAFITAKGNESEGKDIKCLEGGKVVLVGKNPKSKTGLQIVIKTKNHYRSYQHLSGTLVNRGDFVEFGDIIGKCGSTGNITGAHLHTDKYYRLAKPGGLKDYIHAAYKIFRKGIQIITDIYYVDPGVKVEDL